MIDIARISEIVESPERVITGKIPKEYLSDGLGHILGDAGVLVFPKSTEEVSRILQYAWEQEIPVTPRGAGTNLVGSTIPSDGGIVLDFSQMNRILEIDRENLIAVVEPGVVLQDLQNYVEAQGLFYPPDPGEKTATIGGNIATNAGGMRAVKYGVTRDYVRGLELVLADGRILEVGGKIVKDSSGLSLKHLVIGSEGTLAVITKCILRLLPKPKETIGVLIPYDSLKKGIDTVLEIIQENVDPTAVEFIERKAIADSEAYVGAKFPYEEADAYLLMTFDGEERQQVIRNIDQVREIAKRSGALDFLVLEDPKVQQMVWKIRGAICTAIEEYSEQVPMDIVVPINKIAEFVEYVNTQEKNSGIRMVTFGHAGDGNVHMCVMREGRDEETWAKISGPVMLDIYRKSQALGGLPSGEHGIGLSKKPYFLKVTDPLNVTLMKQIKLAVDGKNILNPSVIFD